MSIGCFPRRPSITRSAAGRNWFGRCPGDGPFIVAPGASADEVLVANSSSDSVSVIDTSSNDVVGSPITVGDDPTAIVITPDGSKAYVSNEGSDTVSVIDLAAHTTIGSPIPVTEAGALAASPDGARST